VLSRGVCVEEPPTHPQVLNRDSRNWPWENLKSTSDSGALTALPACASSSKPLPEGFLPFPSLLWTDVCCWVTRFEIQHGLAPPEPLGGWEGSCAVRSVL